MGSFISWLIVGLLAGGLASMIVPGRTPGGTFGALGVGLIGGVIGGWILDLLDVSTNLSWIGSLVVGTIGAVIVLYAMRAMSNRT